MCGGEWEEGLNALVAHVFKSNAMGEDALMAAGRFLKMSKLELRAISVAFMSMSALTPSATTHTCWDRHEVFS